MVRLIIQPGGGISALLKAIDGARKRIQVMIFRFDQKAIEHALTRAAERGVFVHALIAFTNRGGEEHLRALEQRLLDKGITVARTADDLVRYHAKYMIVDDRELFLLAFNFTHLDIERSRSVGIVTRDAALVREAARLFECDVKRLPYKSSCARFVVSPTNSRDTLLKFISDAKEELLIYDPEVSDRDLLRALKERFDAGVKVAIIGKSSSKGKSAGKAAGALPWRKLNGMRLHLRAIIRDAQAVFVGSQSLRKLELDARREAGVVIRDAKAAAALRSMFQKDWRSAKRSKEMAKKNARKVPVKKTAKRVAKVIANKLPVRPVVSHVIEIMRQDPNLNLHPSEVEQTVKEAVKDALKDAVKDAARKVVKTVVEEQL